jgi:hypothetical protein
MQRDFLMRMIAKLSQAFFRIVAGKSVDDPEQAIVEIEDLLSEALQSPREFVLGQGPAAIETLEASLAAEVARLLMLHGDISERLGDRAKARRARIMGLHALKRAMDRPDAEFAKMASTVLRDGIDVITRISLQTDMADTCMAAHQVARAHGQWDDAEDWLFWALELESDGERVAAGEDFYEFLGTLDEETLAEGGLSESEIEDGRRELEVYR